MAAKNPSTKNPFITLEASKTKEALITKINNPKVKIFIGKVNNTKIGLITAFTIPKNKESHNAVQKLATVIPGIK